MPLGIHNRCTPRREFVGLLFIIGKKIVSLEKSQRDLRSYLCTQLGIFKQQNRDFLLVCFFIVPFIRLLYNSKSTIWLMYSFSADQMTSCGHNLRLAQLRFALYKKLNFLFILFSLSCKNLRLQELKCTPEIQSSPIISFLRKLSRKRNGTQISFCTGFKLDFVGDSGNMSSVCGGRFLYSQNYQIERKHPCFRKIIYSKEFQLKPSDI